MIGVDFGGTRIKAARVDNGRVIRSDVVETPAECGPTEVLDTIAEVVKKLGGGDSVGVAIPGEVDENGRCYRLPNVPGFEGVEIGSELTRRLDAKIVVENDATTAALGELIYGHGRRYPSFLLATLGTGIGGGLAIDGRVRRGHFGFAAELGHVLVDSSPNAWPCPCGLTGCMEAYAGTVGLLRRYAELGGKAETPRDIGEAARAGDENAREAFASMGRALGVGLTQAQKLLDLDALVFSGGVSASFDLMEPELRATLRRMAFGPPTAEIPLLVSELGEHAGVIGASELHRLSISSAR